MIRTGHSMRISVTNPRPKQEVLLTIPYSEKRTVQLPWPDRGRILDIKFLKTNVQLTVCNLKKWRKEYEFEIITFAFFIKIDYKMDG